MTITGRYAVLQMTWLPAQIVRFLLGERELMLVRYDRRAAATYALRFALNYNPEWPSYKGAGGDCTNFVSQALYAGGWTMLNDDEYGGSKSIRSWFSKRSDPRDHSWTWSNATEFYHFLQNSIGTRVWKCDPGRLALGDVVQLRDFGIVHHTVIVTGVLPTSIKRSTVAFVTYHTNDIQQTALVEIANKKGDNLICWKVMDTFESPEEDSDSGGPSLYEP